MRNKLSLFLVLHLAPVLISLLIVFLSLFEFQNIFFSSIEENVDIINGEQKLQHGRLPNFDAGIQSEIEFAGCLENKNYLTLLGSSEFTDSPYCPYNFLPDSLQMPTVGFGHAYMQSFSIYCELLAMEKNLNKSKICIIVSPGWFETGGSNIEAFLEFVKPNFFKSILHNKNIPIASKIEIGRYISSQSDLIESPSKNILFFKKLYTDPLVKNSKLVQKFLLQKATLNSSNKDVKYLVKHSKNTLPIAKKINWELSREKLQKAFISSIKDNSMYVNDKYFNEYILDENKKIKKGFNYDVVLKENQEYKDFKLLVQFLKKKKCKVSFVIQPLNPYHFSDLNGYNEVLDSVQKIIKNNNYPCLNLFTDNKKDYDPGTLSDVMHFNDYGWMKVNEFLYNTYKKKN